MLNGELSLAGLGKQLFFDPRLSANGQVSCASCHVPEKAFTDGRTVAQGIDGRLGTRNTPSLWLVAQQSPFFWDGRRASLEEQVLDPFTNPQEHGLQDLAALLAILRADVGYSRRFEEVFGQPSISAVQVAKALVAYLGTLIPGRSAFDRYRAGDLGALSHGQKRGLALFTGRARCSACHVVQGEFPSFTDHRLHRVNHAARWDGKRLAQLTNKIRGISQQQLGHLITMDQAVAALGRYVLTQSPADLGRFKTPSLRNVVVTGPYFHDGSTPNLAEAVEQELYYRSQQGNPVVLKAEEKQDLLDFLSALTTD